MDCSCRQGGLQPLDCSRPAASAAAAAAYPAAAPVTAPSHKHKGAAPLLFLHVIFSIHQMVLWIQQMGNCEGCQAGESNVDEAVIVLC